MRTRMIVAFAVVAASVVAFAAMSARSNSLRSAPEYDVPALPDRKAKPTPPPAPLPSLPAAAETLQPVQFTVVTTWRDAGRRQRQTQQLVMRSSDRIRIVLEGARKEWLFERNPVDHRRVSGYLVDHEARKIFVHQESDLRNDHQLRGWADVLMMRFDPTRLSELHDTGERKTAGGATFARYTRSSKDDGDGVADVWWSETLLLPLRVSVRQRGVVTTSTIARIEQPPGLAELADPRTRFPKYGVLDIADAREDRH